MKSIATIILIFTITSQLLFSQSANINEIKTVSKNFSKKVNTNFTIKNIIPVFLGDIEVFFAVNFNEGGFVLVSSDKNCKPILAYSKKSAFYNLKKS